MKYFAWALAAVGCIVAGAAQAQGLRGVYLHDDAIGTQADSIDAAAQGASTLKPYDDQSANLTAFAAQENLAMATQWVAYRDFKIQQLIGQPSSGPQGDERSRFLVADACTRLTELITLPTPCGAASEQEPATVNLKRLDIAKLRWLNLQFYEAVQQATQAQVWINADITNFTRQYPDLPAPTCATVTLPPGQTAPPPDPPEIATLNASLKDATDPATQQRLRNAISLLQDGLGQDCTTLTNAQKGQKGIGFQAANSIGMQVVQAVNADEAATAAAGDAALKPLSDQLAAVKKAGASKTDLAKLQGIESDLESALEEIDPVAKLFKLNHVDGELSQVATALACEKTSPACATEPSGSIDAKTAAVLGVLNAAAQVADVNAGRADESHWIAAAQAIVAAYKADAQTVTDAGAAMAAVVTQSQALAAQETALLAKSILLAAGDSKDVSDVVGCEGQGFECALPAYVDSWNEGRAPAAVLAYREVQVYRAFNVQRQRQAAQAQRALLLAATATLKAYGDGGIQPQTVAQWVQALAIIGIAAK